VWGEEIIDKKLIGAVRKENKAFGIVDYVSPRESTCVFSTCPEERSRMIFQLGTASGPLASEAALLVHKDVRGIDVNMGCPKSFSVKGGMGAALLDRPEIVEDILKTLRRTLPARKLERVQKAAQSSKQNTKLNQQRLEWIEQARKHSAEARRLEDDLRDCASGLCLLPELTEEMRAGAESASDIWFQVSGVRQLLLQLRRRDSERLRRAPDQAVALQGVLSSVAAALGSLGPHLAAQAAELEDEIGASRRGLRRELAAEGLWAAHGERAAEDRCDLSDEEDGLMERIGDGPEDFQAELGGLNEQVSKELAQLEQELAELRRKRAGWDDAAHFRFRCILREFQGKNRELITDRLSLEFPHLSREQLQQHEVLCDSLKYATQKQASAFRQWRRERLALLRKHQGRVEERFKAQGAMAARRQDMLEVKEKGKQLQGARPRESAENSPKSLEADDRVQRLARNAEI
ncbi:unnamed protein product, partial [Polarella glacialis]